MYGRSIFHKGCGMARMWTTLTWRCLVARLLCMYKKNNWWSLMLKWWSASFWDTVMNNLVIDFEIPRTGGWFVVVMWSSWRIKWLRTSGKGRCLKMHHKKTKSWRRNFHTDSCGSGGQRWFTGNLTWKWWWWGWGNWWYCCWCRRWWRGAWSREHWLRGAIIKVVNLGFGSMSKESITKVCTSDRKWWAGEFRLGESSCE